MTDTMLTPPAEIAKRVLHRIETDPASHEQGLWVNWPGIVQRLDDGMAGERVEAAATALAHVRAGGCGTTACVAGWAVIEALDMGAEVDMSLSISVAAAGLLGFQPGEAEAGDLFSAAADRGLVTDTLAAIAEGAPAAEAVNSALQSDNYHNPEEVDR